MQENESSIIRQELETIDDCGKKVTRLKSTVAFDSAIDSASLSSGRTGSGSSEIRVMGFIPPELFAYDPILKAATRAKREGDSAEYTKLMRSFFNLNKHLAPVVERKYWTGGTN